MNSNLKISIVSDEIDPDIDTAIEFAKINNIKNFELRTIGNKNLIDFSIDEARLLYSKLTSNDISVSAIASPLFKWYPSTKKFLSNKVDTFYFDPFLSLEKKQQYIKKACALAEVLNTNNIRIFSTLKQSNTRYAFEKDPLLKLLLINAKDKKINILLENEPPCYLNKIDHFKKVISDIPYGEFGIWFDVANFYKVSERVKFSDLQFLREKIRYFHIKDIGTDNRHVQLGNGRINYKRIISDIIEVFNGQEIYLSLEPHLRPINILNVSNAINTLRELIDNKRVKYGIIGCGKVFKKHASAITNNPLSELRMVYDSDIKKNIKVANEFDCEPSQSTNALISDSRIDIVNIRTPNSTHYDLVRKCISSNKICLCEKPMCLKLSDAKQILRQQTKFRTVFVNFQNRYNPTIQLLFSLLKTNRLGKISHCAVCVRCWRDNEYFKDWHGKKNMVGGMLYNQGAHAIDLIQKICGSPKRIYKIIESSRTNTKVDDKFLAILKFGSGITGNLEITTSARFENFEASIFLTGSRGSIKIKGQSFNEIEYASENIKREIEIYFNRNKFDENSHYRLIEDLNQKIIFGTSSTNLPTAKDGYNVTKTILKLYGY